MIRLISIFVLTMWVLPANALTFPERTTSAERTVELCWSAPATRVNGDVLAAEEIGGYELYYGLVSSSDEAGVIAVPANAHCYTFGAGVLGTGLYMFSISTYDTSLPEPLYSDPSEPVQAMVDRATGPAPVELTVVQKIVAWVKSVFSWFA